MTDAETVTVAEEDYAELLGYWNESQYHRREAVAIVREWLKQAKGTDEISTGLRLCTALELRQLADQIGQGHLHDCRNWIWELQRRLTEREKAAAAARKVLEELAVEMPEEAGENA